MLAQRLLEGEAYATISLVSYLIFKVRKNLETLRDSVASSLHVLSIATRMTDTLDEIFGSGSEGAVASDTLPEGPRRRPRGNPILTLMASLLDPRMKGRVGIPEIDKEFVFGKIKEYMIAISRELDERIREQEHNNNDDDDDIPPANPVHVHEPSDIDMMFDDLNESYIVEQQQQGHNRADKQVSMNNNNWEQHCINLVEAELLLYQQEPSIRLYKEEGSTLTAHLVGGK